MSGQHSSLLFVYGTLRAETDTAMARLLQHYSRNLGAAKMCGRLYDAGSFPAAVYDLESSHAIHGNLHAIANTNALFEQLDNYEGYRPSDSDASLFVRDEVAITFNDRKVTAFTYLFNRSVNQLNCIPSGDYLKYCSSNQ